MPDRIIEDAHRSAANAKRTTIIRTEVQLNRDGHMVAVFEADTLEDARDIAAEWESGATVGDIGTKDRRK